MEEIKHLLPDMDEEQTLNTKDFLRLIAHTCNTNTCCLIMRQNILTRDTYKQLRNPLDGKLHYVLENGDRIITGRKGIDWCKPGIYDVAHGDELMRLHEHCYPVKRRITKEWWDPVNNEYIAHKETVYVAPIRPSLYHTILTAGNKQKYLFAPATVALHPKIKYERTEYGIEYPTINHYTIADVRYARCLWVDIHGRNLPAKDIRQENPKALDQFMAILPTYCRQTGVPIPAVIDSGHGVQLYWWLEQAVQIHDAAAQDQFREILRAVNNWAKDLIRRLPLCNQTWTSDYTATPVYHLMDVPGCIDIRTGKRIYVVNRYGVDYTHYAYEALCKALGVRCGSEAQDRSDTEKTSADVTILDNLEGSAEESTLPSKSDSSPFPRYSPRVDKLLCWAEQRQWSLDHCRHLFLFCLGVVQQCGADIDLTNPENYPLHEINHKLKTPLSHQEVENIISSLITKARSGYQYYIRDETLAQKLHMTEAEREWFCSPGGRPIDSRPAKLDFHNVMNWIIDRTTWDLEHELFPEFIHRCHDLTIRWYEENRRDKNRNGARTRARKSREGYSPEGGRPPKYSDRDRDQCIALKAEGFSIAKISRELGIPESTVRRFSKTSQKYEL